MAQVKQGNTVQVNYTGKLKDGTVFDTSYGRCPMQFTLGQGKLIAGFEQAVIGMSAGEKKTVVIPSDQAYGQPRQANIIKMDRKTLPADMDPKVGQRLEITQENDQKVLTTITGISDTNLTLDANHPLSGKDLTFEIELVSIVG